MEEKKLTLIVTVLHGEEILSKETKVMNDELLGLREGAFALEHQITGLGTKVVREIFKKQK